MQVRGPHHSLPSPDMGNLDYRRPTVVNLYVHDLRGRAYRDLAVNGMVFEIAPSTNVGPPLAICNSRGRHGSADHLVCLSWRQALTISAANSIA
jgi:hypothetical protein